MRLMWMMVVMLMLAAAVNADVVVNGKTRPRLEVERIELRRVNPECSPRFCDANDTNCDGVIDEACPGLEYDICRDGSIVFAYIQAAFTGQCVEEPEPATPSCCPIGDVCLSPARPCPY